MSHAVVEVIGVDAKRIQASLKDMANHTMYYVSDMLSRDERLRIAAALNAHVKDMPTSKATVKVRLT